MSALRHPGTRLLDDRTTLESCPARPAKASGDSVMRPTGSGKVATRFLEDDAMTSLCILGHPARVAALHRLAIAAAVASLPVAGVVLTPDRLMAEVRRDWRPPVRGTIISGFGARPTGFHRGVDIRAERGTPVVAPAAGSIAFAGWQSGYGKTVVVKHGSEVKTLYGHLSRIRVNRGQRVARGEVIGHTGSTGRASTPHLHYEVHVRNRPQNPRAFLASARP